MSQQSSNSRIHAAVRLNEENPHGPFGFRDAGSSTQTPVATSGDIDLRRESAGPVAIRFALEQSHVTHDGKSYRLQLAPDSVWIAKQGAGNPRGPFRPGGLAGCLQRVGIGKPQFHRFAAPTPGELTFVDENDDHTAYKYTLRVKGTAEDGTEQWFEHDPLIHNR